MGEYIDPIAETLREDLPSWWAKDRAGSEVFLHCQTYGELADELTAAIEAIYADQSMATASLDALINEWAVIYGAAGETGYNDAESWRAYLQGLASNDGTTAAMEEALLGLLRNPYNDAGTSIVLDATFPADGSSLPMFTSSPERINLVFPADGTGIALDLTFPLVSPPIYSNRVTVYASNAYAISVIVHDWLAFDRAAFLRAAARFRLAHHVINPFVSELSI